MSRVDRQFRRQVPLSTRRARAEYRRDQALARRKMSEQDRFVVESIQRMLGNGR